MKRFVYTIDPKNQTIEYGNTNLRGTLSMVLGNYERNIIEVNDSNSSSNIFVSCDGIKRKAFFKINDFLLGGLGVISSDKSKSELSDLIKWIPTADALAELALQSFLAETELNACGIKTVRTDSLSFDITQ